MKKYCFVIFMSIFLLSCSKKLIINTTPQKATVITNEGEYLCSTPCKIDEKRALNSDKSLYHLIVLKKGYRTTIINKTKSNEEYFQIKDEAVDELSKTYSVTGGSSDTTVGLLAWSVNNIGPFGIRLWGPKKDVVLDIELNLIEKNTTKN